MDALPNPLHPALVHFPIVLILLGAGVSAVSVFLNRWHLPWCAAVLLGMGSIGAYVAAEAGEDAAEQAVELTDSLTPAAESLLHTHQRWAGRTETASLAAAALAVAAAALGGLLPPRNTGASAEPPPGGDTPDPRPKLACGLRALTALTALLACYFLLQTGHAGGRLVYDHGVGVRQFQGPGGIPAPLN